MEGSRILPCGSLYDHPQVIGKHRKREEGVDTQCLGHRARVRCWLDGAHQDHGKLLGRAIFTQLLQYVVSRHVRQMDVHEEQIRLGLRQLQHLDAAAGLNHFCAAFVQ